MADQYDDLSWAVRQRFEFIEWRAYWTGAVTRKDLEDEFNISAAQASADLRSYQERLPQNIEYSTSEKMHVMSQDFKAEFLRLSPERYLLQMQAIETSAIQKSDTWFANVPPVQVIPQIARWPHAYILRELIRAIENKRAVQVNYKSLTKTEVRTICPHAFGYDGNRWHVRAWATSSGEFRDFVLSRILSIGPADHCVYDAADDIEWNTPLTLNIVPYPGLSDAERETIEHDYGIDKGVLPITMPIALAFYFIRRHNLDLRDENVRPVRQQLYLDNYDEVAKITAAAHQISKARAAARKAQAASANAPL